MLPPLPPIKILIVRLFLQNSSNRCHARTLASANSTVNFHFFPVQFFSVYLAAYQVSFQLKGFKRVKLGLAESIPSATAC